MTRWGAPTSEGKPERSSEHWGCSIQEGGGSWGREDLGRHGVVVCGVPAEGRYGTGSHSLGTAGPARRNWDERCRSCAPGVGGREGLEPARPDFVWAQHWVFSPGFKTSSEARVAGSPQLPGGEGGALCDAREGQVLGCRD